MPLYECPDCRGKVSDQAEHCPHCGRPVYEEDIEQGRTQATIKNWFVAAAILASVWYIATLDSSCSEHPVKTTTQARRAVYLSPADHASIKQALEGTGYSGRYETELSSIGWVAVTLKLESRPSNPRALAEGAVLAIRNKLYTRHDHFRVSLYGPRPGPGLVSLYGAARFSKGGSINWDDEY